jgi:hypothetical protein
MPYLPTDGAEPNEKGPDKSQVPDVVTGSAGATEDPGASQM